MTKQSMLKGNKILKFEQPGEFYSRIARKSMEKNDLPEAMSFYRIALNRDPHNVDYRISLANIFTEMGQYDSSNRILIRVARENRDSSSGCYFGIGCNFLGLQEYDNAQESFRRYLYLEPDGEYADEAEELLMMIHEDIEEMTYEDDNQQHAQDVAEQGKSELDVGNYSKAVQTLQRALEMDADMVYARNNLALAYFLNDEVEQAKQQARLVLADNPDNIHALCNLSIFCDVKSGDAEAIECFEKVRYAETDQPDEIYKIALTMCEAGDDAAALFRFETALEFRPYDVRTLFCAGAACYNTGDYKNAIRYFERMNKAEPDDSIGSYYRGIAQKALDDGKRTLDKVGYHCQVPLDEVVRRIKYLNACTGSNQAELKDIWNSDRQFRSYVLWGLKIQDTSIKKAMMELLCLINDDDSEEVLRDYLMQRDEADSSKNEVFALLKKMKAEEPFIAYMKDGLVEARVTVFDTPDDGAVPDSYNAVLQLCMRKLRNRGLHREVDSCMEVWKRLLETLNGSYPRLQNREAWAAALEYIALEHMEKQPTAMQELSDVYNADVDDIERGVSDMRGMLNG